MKFAGLFVGIDRYASPAINWLSCARRDAIALHALFTDTLGGDSKLLLDSEATRANIEKELKELQKCGEDDFVVIAFSGHGSPTHQLISYDADIRDLDATAIPLETLTNWFSHISSKRLFFILDCCFSGGMGAKVLQLESLPRSMDSVEKLLEQLSGEGRLIITASTATEPAWENQKFGQGFLTHFLIEALQGAEEVLDSGKIHIYRLLEHITKQVSSAAAQIGKKQNPTFRGKIDGEVMLPVFKPGKMFNAAFPEKAKPKVTEDPNSLSAWGFPSEIISAWTEGAIKSLNSLQLEAINEFRVLEGQHLIGSAPTSSGKTMIGELAALASVLERKRAFFLFPLKALVNDKHKHFTKLYGGYGVKTIRATGDMSDDVPALTRGQYDICLMTYEKFTALVLGNPHLLEQVGAIVVDEVQMIADRNRGVNLEFILTLLRMRRREGIEPQLVALSAVIGDTNGFEQWMGARLLRREERPVPLDEGILTSAGSFRFVSTDKKVEESVPNYIHPELRKGSSQDLIIPLVRRLVGDGKQVIVFREIRGEARGCASYLAKALGLPPAAEALKALPGGDPSLASNILRECLQGGVAFHISDLDRDERAAIEEEFRKPESKIRVIVATTTLAMGVNTPAEAVVVAGLMHPGDEPYSVAEYKNIVGRAGRLGYTTRGSSHLLALTPMEEQGLWRKYVQGKPENLESRFFEANTDLRSLIVRVLAAASRFAGVGLRREAIIEFLEGSFGSFQKARISQQQAINVKDILSSLENLALHKLIRSSPEEVYELTELGWLAGQGGVEVESITRLVETLGPVSTTELNDPTLIAATQLTVELDQLFLPLNKKSSQKEPQEWNNALRQQLVAPHVLGMMRRFAREEHEITMRCKRAAACLLWISELPISQIETILTQFWGKFDGAAGPVRGVAARTYDLLPTTMRVAEILHPDLKLDERGIRLLTRLEVGVPASMIEIASYLGNALARGDYQSLLKGKITNMESVNTATDEVLLTDLGDDEGKLMQLRAAAKKYQQEIGTRKAKIEFPEYRA